jgi:hypothetical protein
MDKRAAGQYLDTLFGRRAGHVAVAYKDRGESWQEHTFEWPKGRTSLLRWAEIHKDANVFICPALRKSAGRIKGDMQPTKWLWADVDWDKVPDVKKTYVQARIKQLGSLVVMSGSGANVHVYVEMDRNLTVDEHRKLNTGLRDYLYADAKHADNSLLRLMGTTNWKTEAGSAVKLDWRNEGGVSTVDGLMGIETFKKAKVIDMDSATSEWKLVEIEGLTRRIKAMVSMSEDEAKARYGKRHTAVWAVTRELYRKKFDDDEIHTLLDNFPPAIAKHEDEHNGYDWHRDISRCLIACHVADEESLTEEQAEELSDEMEAADTDDPLETEEEYRNRLIAKANEIRFQEAARKMARELEAESSWVAPPDDVSWDLSDVLKDPPPPAQYIIGVPPGGKRGLAGVKHNVIITAQYKTGKTKFVIATIAKALCDGEDFAGVVPVHTPEGGVVVAHWNCEMDADEMAGEYVIPAGVVNVHNLKGANLRGHRINLLTPQGKRWTVDWLKSRGVKVWTIDSLARLARMAGVSEKDNDEMFDLLMAIDEVKVEAGVDVVFLITHTGRTQMEEGKERARGATAIDDWCDARWIMTEDSGVRFLAVDGRGVGMDSTSLDYDEETGHSKLSGLTKSQSMAHGWGQVAMELVNGMGSGRPLSESALVTKMQEKAKAAGKKLGVATAKVHIIDAVDAGYIERKREPGPRGPMVWNHYPVGKPEGDRTRKATPRDVNMAAMPRRKRSQA